MSKLYRIENTRSGHVLGDWVATDSVDAWVMCCADAGYKETQEQSPWITIYAVELGAPDHSYCTGGVPRELWARS